MKNMNESKNGFWGVLARKAKSIIEDDNVPQQSEMAGVGRSQLPGVASRGKVSLELYLKFSAEMLLCMLYLENKNQLNMISLV